MRTSIRCSFPSPYRRPARTIEEEVELTLEIISGFKASDIPWTDWPKDYEEILKAELNDYLAEALWVKATAHSIASSLLAEGYSTVVTNDAA